MRDEMTVRRIAKWLAAGGSLWVAACGGSGVEGTYSWDELGLSAEQTPSLTFDGKGKVVGVVPVVDAQREGTYTVDGDTVTISGWGEGTALKIAANGDLTVTTRAGATITWKKH